MARLEGEGEREPRAISGELAEARDNGRSPGFRRSLINEKLEAGSAGGGARAWSARARPHWAPVLVTFEVDAVRIFNSRAHLRLKSTQRAPLEGIYCLVMSCCPCHRPGSLFALRSLYTQLVPCRK